MSCPGLLFSICYSCGPAQLVCIIAVPYNLLYATKCKIQLHWELFHNLQNPEIIGDNFKSRCKQLEEKVANGLNSAKFHSCCAFPILGTLCANSLDRKTIQKLS